MPSLKSAQEAAHNQTPESIDSSARAMGIDINRVRRAVNELPEDYAGVNELGTRTTALQEKFDAALVRAQGQAGVRRIEEQVGNRDAVGRRGLGE